MPYYKGGKPTLNNVSGVVCFRSNLPISASNGIWYFCSPIIDTNGDAESEKHRPYPGG